MGESVLIAGAVGFYWRAVGAASPQARYAVIIGLHQRAARWWLTSVALMASALAMTYLQVADGSGGPIWVITRCALAVASIAALAWGERGYAIAGALQERCIDADAAAEARADATGRGELLTRRLLRDYRG